MRKKLIIVLSIFIAVMAFVSVFIIYPAVKRKNIKHITFRITWDELSARGLAIGKIVDEYNESQSKIFVTLVGGNEDRDDFLAELGNDSVDVYMMPYRYLKDTEISEKLLLLDDLYAANEQYYYDTIKMLAQSENGVAGIPWIGHSMGLIYNKDIVTTAGVNPEEFTSLDDLLKACKIIYETTGAGGLGLVGADAHDITWMMSQFIYSFGGALVATDEEGNQTDVLINSDESEQALDFYINKLGQYAQDGWQEDTGTEVMEAFANGEIAFEIQGPWGITDIWKRGDPFELGAISLSQIGMYSEVGPLMLSVSADSVYADEAKEFISYLTDKTTLEDVMDGEYDDKYEEYYPYRVPLRTDMEDSDFFKQYPEFLVFIEGYEMPSIDVPTHAWENEYKDLYEYYANQAVLGNITIKEALANIADKVQK